MGITVDEGMVDVTIVPIFEELSGSGVYYTLPVEVHLEGPDKHDYSLHKGDLVQSGTQHRFAGFPEQLPEEDRETLLQAMIDEVWREIDRRHLKPLREWLCDHCGGIIKTSADGVVAVDRPQKLFDWSAQDWTNWRLTHADDDCAVGFRPGILSMMVGLTSIPTALARILSMMGDEPIPSTGSDIIKRLTIPYYEEARLYDPLPVDHRWPEWPDLSRPVLREHVLEHKAFDWRHPESWFNRYRTAGGEDLSGQ